MRTLEQEQTDDRQGSDAERFAFNLEAIEAAFRALRGQPGTISGIQICLPTPSSAEPDLPLDRIIDRWGTTFASTARIEHEDELIVVTVERERVEDAR